MKPEDMTREQLIAEIKRYWVIEADLTFRMEQACARFKQANAMRNSYIQEFADRGLIHIPKIPKGVEE